MSDENLSGYRAPEPSGTAVLTGNHVRLEPLDFDRHLTELFAAGHEGTRDEIEARWRYLPGGPFADEAALEGWIKGAIWSQNAVTYAVIDGLSGSVQGMLSYLRIRPAHGSLEVGAVLFGPRLAQTRGATEAIYLVACDVFETLGYRRFEWKCNAANAASRRAATRFGFLYEGVFRQDMVVKGKNRDTAWFAMTDKDWPVVRNGFRTWLQDDNFDKEFQQRKSLMECRETVSPPRL